MQISIVIPLLNEEESLAELYQWLTKVLTLNRFSYEIIFVDDGSTDGSWRMIMQLAEKDAQVRGIRFLRNYGKSQALHAGFKAAEGEVVITMDADLQDSPDEIPALYAKNLPSKLFNWAARKTSGLTLHDFNCGLKAYKKEVIKNVEVSGEMHRYIPVLAKNAGFNRITEKVVQHQARKYGVTKFGMSRFINGFLDLITISFLSHFGKRPMHFFGALGVLMFFIGFLFSAYLGIDKLFINPNGRLIADRPQFYLALTTMLIGTQFFIAGFLGEIILKTKNNEERYKISELVNGKNSK